MPCSRISRLMLLLAVAGLAAPAHGQSFSTDLDVATEAHDIVVTASRTPRSLAEIGESVSVITGEEIETRQSATVLDLLRTVPGLTIARNGGPGAVASVFIRGADSDQTVALIDGIKLNDPASPGGGFNFGTLLAGNIDRIEVVRGAQSVVWGSQAIGGVVNLITRAPTDAFEAKARFEAGWRDSYQLFGNVSGRSGPVAGSIGGGFFSSDGISAFNEARGGDERDGYGQFAANGKLLVDLAADVSIDLRAFYADGETEVDGYPPPDFVFADTSEVNQTEEFVGYAGVNAALFDGAFRNRLAFTYTDIERRSLDPEGALAVTFEGRGSNERFEYQGVFAASERLEAVFGAQSETQRYDSASFGGPRSGAQVSLGSLYAQVSGEPLAGLNLTGGVRHDDHEIFGGQTTFAANGVFSPNRGTTRVRASYGEGFKAPSLFQLYSDFGNLALAPETARSWDIGIVQRLLGDALELGATYFRRDSRNQIDFISCFGNASPICTGRPFGTYDNIRRTRAEGIEAVLAARPLEGLRVQAQYSLIETQNRETGLDLARRPRQTASLVGNYRWPFGLEAGLTIAHVGDSFDDAANARRLEGYVLIDLRAAWPVSEAIEIYGRIENLFGEAYETVLLYGTPGRAGHVGVRLQL